MNFTFTHLVQLPVADVFAFHACPEHLELLMREWPGFRLLHHDKSVLPGSRTWCEQSIVGIIPVVMGFEHSIYEPPRCFGERLIHGPFAKFTHLHEFVEHPEGTIIRDVLEMVLPWQYGGQWATRCVLPGFVGRFFAYRRARLDHMAADGTINRLAATRSLSEV